MYHFFFNYATVIGSHLTEFVGLGFMFEHKFPRSQFSIRGSNVETLRYAVVLFALLIPCDKDNSEFFVLFLFSVSINNRVSSSCLQKARRNISSSGPHKH